MVIEKIQAGDLITIEDQQYSAVRAERYSCKGCAFYKLGSPCFRTDSVVASCIANDIIFKTV